ncbi:MAG: SPOR domain-containing protein [Methylophilaceae bacterium]
MPPEKPNDLELDLKKRARRRLVGAIALVILMIIILPIILKDRTGTETQKEDIKISMPEPTQAVASSTQEHTATATSELPAIQSSVAPIAPDSTASALPSENTIKSTVPMPDETVVTKPEPVVKPLEVKPLEVKPLEVKPIETKPATVKPTEHKPVDAKTADEKTSAKGSFTIQIGVFSDPANVAQLQAKLNAAGFSARTEKINTPNGEKTRIRVGKYITRQDAADALTSLNATGMTGMVITNK